MQKLVCMAGLLIKKVPLWIWLSSLVLMAAAHPHNCGGKASPLPDDPYK
jgi:hypothetical protein